jgi:hypothetical protein
MQILVSRVLSVNVVYFVLVQVLYLGRLSSIVLRECERDDHATERSRDEWLELHLLSDLLAFVFVRRGPRRWALATFLSCSLFLSFISVYHTWNTSFGHSSPPIPTFETKPRPPINYRHAVAAHGGLSSHLFLCDPCLPRHGGNPAAIRSSVLPLFVCQLSVDRLITIAQTSIHFYSRHCCRRLVIRPRDDLSGAESLQ